jgi:hypothetical protein
MAYLWTQPSGTILAELEEEVTTTIPLPVLTRADVSLISGNLPPGMRLSGNTIEGTPYEVARKLEYRFVLRATLDRTIRDRTFTITVSGPDNPEWVTDPGLLPVGNNNTFYILDSSPIDFQLLATDQDLEAGQTLEYYIGEGDGELPPGTSLTADGRIVGIVDPLLAIERGLLYSYGTYDTAPYDLISGGYDFGIRSSNGFDSFYYDTTVWDFSYTEQPPKKLNRYYQFTVSVTDGDTISRRTFRIFVVGDDFFRADNTILQVGTGTFTADNTNLRTPIWITPSDLGIKRANNYITITLDIIDTNSQVGFVSYSVDDTNDDGSPSILPPGLSLDLSNGEIAGRVPYQSDVSKTYKFTIRATRYTPDQIDENVSSAKTFTVKLLGEFNSNTTWITDSDLGTLNSNVISVLNVEAETDVPNARVLYSLASGRLPPGLQLTFDGEIVGKVNAFGQNVYKSLWKPSRNYKAGDVVKYNDQLWTTNSDHLSASSGVFEDDSALWIEYSYTRAGLTVFDNDTFVLDGAETTVDRVYTFTVNAEDQYKYSIAQKEFFIRIRDPETTRYSNIYMKPFLKEDIKAEFNAFISDPEVFIPEYIYRPQDPNFGIQKSITIPVYYGIETKTLSEFVAAMATNHKRKQYRIGDLKTAVANEPGTNNPVYEVVYLEVVDPANPSTGRTNKSFNISTNNKITVDSITASPSNIFYDWPELPSFAIQLRGRSVTVTLGEDFEIETRDDGTADLIWTDGLEIDGRTEDKILAIAQGLGPTMTLRPQYDNPIKADNTVVNASQSADNLRYISNISNMRDNIRNVGVTDRNFVPLWMRSSQPGSVNELGYTSAIVLCYCKPGTSDIIKAAINARDFDFSQFNLDLDRYIIDSTDITSEPQYLLFANYRYNV